MAIFEQKLRNVITHFCETPKAFADLMGVSPQVVSNWIARGIKNVDTLQEIFAKLPNLNPSYFFDENGDMLRTRTQETPTLLTDQIERLREENEILRDEIIRLHLEMGKQRQDNQKVAG